MATSQITPPPGFELEHGASTSSITPPPGFELEGAQPARSAASPISPPALKVGAPSSAGMHPSFLLGDPSHDATPQNPVTGMMRGIADVSAPVIAHRMGQRAGIIPEGDLYQNEGQLKDVPGKATMALAGGLEGPEAEAGAVAESAPRATGRPGMVARVAKAQLDHTPLFSYARDMVRAIKGPEPVAPAPPVARPAPPDFGTPQALRGTRILSYPGAHLPEHPGTFPGAPLPEKPPTEVFQARGLANGGGPIADPASALGDVLIRKPVVRPPLNYPPEAPRVIAAPTEPNPARARFLEDKSTQEQIRDAADLEDQSRQSQEKREWFARNQPGLSKAELTGQSEKPVTYTKTSVAKANAGGKSRPAPGPASRPDEDLTPILKKSLAAAKKGKKGD